jgi:hypothetical protein
MTGLAVAPLRSPAFRRYLVGQLPSVTCSWAQVVALSWVVVQINPRSLGWVVMCQFLPSLLLGPWFGAVVDRNDRRRLLILAEVGLGLVALGYAVMGGADALSLPSIYLLASAWGVINALDTPARRSLVPMLVPPERAASASALTGTVLVLGMTLGTALGAALVAAAGATATFAVNAASFFADVILIGTIRVGTSPRVRRAPHQIRDGIGYVWHSPALRTALLSIAIIATFAFTIQVSVPILAQAAFDGGPALIGAFFTAVTGGSLVGTLVLAARGTSTQATLWRTALVMAGALLATALAPHELLALPWLATAGFAWAYLLGAVIAILQTAEPRLLGRVMSLFAVVLLGGTTLGAPLATALIALAGPRAPFALGALAAGLAAAAATMGRRIEAAGSHLDPDG